MSFLYRAHLLLPSTTFRTMSLTQGKLLVYINTLLLFASFRQHIIYSPSLFYLFNQLLSCIDTEWLLFAFYSNPISYASRAMHLISIASFSVLALIQPVFTSLSPPPQPYPSQQDTTLRPLNIVDYEDSMGLQRRDLNGFSGMVPQNYTHLVYGRPEGKTSG